MWQYIINTWKEYVCRKYNETSGFKPLCASSYKMVLRHKSYADCLVNQSEIPSWGQKSSMFLCKYVVHIVPEQ